MALTIGGQTALHLLAAILATWRVTDLVTIDRISAPLRGLVSALQMVSQTPPVASPPPDEARPNERPTGRDVGATT